MKNSFKLFCLKFNTMAIPMIISTILLITANLLYLFLYIMRPGLPSEFDTGIMTNFIYAALYNNYGGIIPFSMPILVIIFSVISTFKSDYKFYATLNISKYDNLTANSFLSVGIALFLSLLYFITEITGLAAVGAIDGLWLDKALSSVMIGKLFSNAAVIFIISTTCMLFAFLFKKCYSKFAALSVSVAISIVGCLIILIVIGILPFSEFIKIFSLKWAVSIFIPLIAIEAIAYIAITKYSEVKR